MVDLVKIRKKAKEKSDSDAVADEKPVTEAAPASEAEAEVKPAAAESKSESKKAAPPAEEKSKSEPSPKPAEKKPKAPEKKAKSDAAPKAASKGKPAEKKEAAPAKVVDEAAPDVKPVAAVADDVAVEEPDEEILDRLERFKREAGKRRSWVAGAQKNVATVVEEEETADLELLRFRLAGEEYAVDIEKIVEIVPPRGTTRVPNADHAIVGIMSLRGTIVTVFDLRRKLGHPPIGAGQDADRRMIVVEREGETAGFLVDKVSRVVRLDPSELENHPVVSAAEQSDYVGGVFQASDGLVILLDLEKILASQS